MSLSYQIVGSFKVGESIDFGGHLLYIQNTIDAWRSFLKISDSDFTWSRADLSLGRLDFVDDKSQSIGVVIHIINYILGNTELGLVNFSHKYLIVYNLFKIVLNLLMCFVIFLVFYEYTKNKILGLITVTIINTLPIWFGHLIVNPRDTFLACGVTIFSCSLILIYYKNLYGYLFYSIGLIISIGTRISILPLIFILFFVFFIFSFKANILNKNFIIKICLYTFFSFVFIFLTNPQLWTNPVFYIFRTIKSASNFDLWGGQLLVDGQYIDGNYPTRNYLLIHFLHQIPILFLILSAIILIFFTLKVFLKSLKINLNDALILVIFAIQLLIVPFYMILNNSIVYNGFRQLLFIIPAFVVITFSSFFIMVKHNINDYKFLNPILLTYIFVTLIFQAFMFPYNYIYYNEIAALKGINYNWEKDYFGSSLKELDKYTNKDFPIIQFPQNVEFGLNLDDGSKFKYVVPSEKYYLKIWEDINLESEDRNCHILHQVTKKIYFEEIKLSRLVLCFNSKEENYKYINIDYGFHKNNLDSNIIIHKIIVVKKILHESLCIHFSYENKTNREIKLFVKDFFLKQKNLIYANRHSFIIDATSIRGNQLNVLISPFKIVDGIACFDGEKINFNKIKYYIGYGDQELGYVILAK